MEKFGVSRSTIFPLPSSPHCAPRTAIFGTTAVFYIPYSAFVMILLDGSTLTLEQLEAIAERFEPVALDPRAAAAVDASRAVVDRAAAGDEAAYGINTGFGALAEVKIPKASLAALQKNLVRSHAAGVDAPLRVPAVRAMMALRANVLAKGFSGIRRSTLER